MDQTAKQTLRVSTVEMIGVLESGDTVTQEQQIQHTLNAPEGAIIGEAFKMFRGLGGLLVDGGDETMDFYPSSQLKKVHFVVKKIQIASKGLAVVKEFN